MHDPLKELLCVQARSNREPTESSSLFLRTGHEFLVFMSWLMFLFCVWHTNKRPGEAYGFYFSLDLLSFRTVCSRNRYFVCFLNISFTVSVRYRFLRNVKRLFSTNEFQIFSQTRKPMLSLDIDKLFSRLAHYRNSKLIKYNLAIFKTTLFTLLTIFYSYHCS